MINFCTCLIEEIYDFYILIKIQKMINSLSKLIYMHVYVQRFVLTNILASQLDPLKPKFLAPPLQPEPEVIWTIPNHLNHRSKQFRVPIFSKNKTQHIDEVHTLLKDTTITTASNSEKYLSRTESFQTRCTGSIRFLTLLTGRPDISGEITLGLFFVGSQLSPQILTEVPVPILHEAPRLITSLPLRMLFQALEALLGFLASITEQLGKSFALRTQQNKDCVLWRSRHVCFVKRALLYIDKSLKPNPPYDLGLHMVSHFSQ